MAVNYRQIRAIEKKNKERILEVDPTITEDSGIYILHREEDGIKYAYVGQAKHVLTRLAQHLSGWQRIDNSIRKHGLISKKPHGYKIYVDYCMESDLDRKEQEYIRQVSSKGFQLRNHTTGGQGEGKRGLDNQKSPKGYYDGLRQGYKNAQKEVSRLFEKHLNYSKKSPKPNKNQEKAMQKFEEFITIGDGSDE